MKKYKSFFGVFLLAGIALSAPAQDTALMIKDFNKVMSFAVEPYIYYRSVTNIQVTPVLNAQDTLTLGGEFYKYRDNLYYGSAKDEMFIQDSFYIQVNHERKTIWISKVTPEARKKLNYLPLDDKQLQSLFRKKFTISESEINDNLRQLNFESKQYFDTMALVVVNIGLQYSGKNFIPRLMEMNVRMKQAVTDEQVKELTVGNAKRSIEAVAGVNYFIHNQKVTVTFEAVDNTKEKALQMPSWKDRLVYNEDGKQFSGKGNCSSYEVTKTF